MARKKASHDRGGTRNEKPGKLTRKDYEKHLAQLHIELVKLQQWVKHKGLKVCILFEGRDVAGKGGTIKAITERVSPRVYRVVALPAPTDREKTELYVKRYAFHTPAAGEIVIWDRSWYNRAGVERVMALCSEEEVKRFLELTPLFEKIMVEEGIILLKYWLEVGMEEQTRRLEARIHDGRKIWKLCRATRSSCRSARSRTATASPTTRTSSSRRSSDHAVNETMLATTRRRTRRQSHVGTTRVIGTRSHRHTGASSTHRDGVHERDVSLSAATALPGR